jgi:hypothetical protein
MLSLRAAARLAGVAPSTLLRYLDAGDGPEGAAFTTRPNGRRRWRIPHAATLAWTIEKFNGQVEYSEWPRVGA